MTSNEKKGLKRRLIKKTEELLKNCPNSEMTEAIKKDRRRREQKKKELT